MDGNEDREAALDRMVRRFYERGLEDAVLGPVFRGSIHDFEGHFRIVADFWSHALYGTTRYRGRPFPSHLNLPVEPEHFDRWLALFREVAAETLPPLEAGQAVARAEHMSRSFQAGLFPFIHPNGRISRHPYKGGAT